MTDQLQPPTGEAVAQTDDLIAIFGLDDGEEELGLFVSRAEARYQRNAIPVDRLANQFADFVEKMSKVVGTVPAAIAGFHVEEISFTAQVNAKGSVNLLGTGGEIAGGGGVTVKLIRTP
jgi:hypothetical protein